ncbi:GpE family phage tail protein [Limnobaculum xujianqingii]|nr:GpE family phage tail protein [Limnobaculum xujianqingii]
MADIAVVFHWRPADMDAMTVTELLSWREQAADRSGNNSS